MGVHTTVVFTDLTGSTALFESLGNDKATETVTRLNRWISEVVEAHEGQVVKNLGDGVLSSFADPADALAASLEIQRSHQIRLARWPATLRTEIKIGIASGEVVVVDGDCYGDAVNVAARLCERAGPAEIWATETAVLLSGAAPSVWYRKLGMMEIRGKAEMLMLYQVEWRENEEPDSLTMQASLASNFAPVDSILGQIQFSWHGIDLSFTSTDVPVHIGRATDARLCINDPRVSRLHARIDWRNTGFVLTDMSSFGTWVRFEGSDVPVQLRRDACILHGVGEMALGVSFADSSAPVVKFQVAGGNAHLG